MPPPPTNRWVVNTDKVQLRPAKSSATSSAPRPTNVPSKRSAVTKAKFREQISRDPDGPEWAKDPNAPEVVTVEEDTRPVVKEEQDKTPARAPEPIPPGVHMWQPGEPFPLATTGDGSEEEVGEEALC